MADSLASLPCSSQSVGPASQLLGLLIQTIFADQCGLLPDWPQDYGPTAEQNGLPEYDFIVVGAGSAGSVVASRLSENKNWKVLLLEAGGDPPLESTVPILSFYLLNTQYDWTYYAEPSLTGSLGTKSGAHIPRGKMLGGCSSHNDMLYVRGNRRDYDHWAELGNPTWNWDNVVKYFKKSEDNRDPTIAADKRYHSTAGPLKIDHFNYTGNVQFSIKDSFEQMGYKYLDDINADKHIGTVLLEATNDYGERSSAAKAFLVPAKDRPNLNVIKNARVTNVLFHADGSASGVNFVLSDGTNLQAYSKKEVILSAGVINTPQILMLSGIGPQDVLQRNNVTVRHNLPVGRNFQDHVIVPLAFSYHEKLSQAMSEEYIADSYFQYLTTGKNYFGTLGFQPINGFVSTVNDPLYPDIQFNVGFFAQNNPYLRTIMQSYNYKDEIIQSVYDANTIADSFFLITDLLNPASRGSIEIQSNNPFDPPKIYTNYLAEKSDVDTLIAGIRIGLKMLNTTAMNDVQGQFIRMNLTDCDSLQFDSDQYWECYARQLSSTAYHSVGSCKMGPRFDREAVVDSRLRVHGVKGLRVIDASIMPKVISGNTNAPTIMIGEKGSDFIKQDWRWYTYAF